MQSPFFVLAIVLGALVVFVFAAITISGFSGGFGVTGFLFAPFCGVVLVIVIVVVLMAAQGMGRAPIPPPPPIQQPMVPAGQQGPVALSCPNCGAPPTVVDRFGVATCTYCNTRFLVR